MVIVLVVAHAPWNPHRGGGGTPVWGSECALSRAVTALTSAKLRELGHLPRILEMPEAVDTPEGDHVVLRCSGAHPPEGICARYTYGVRWITRQARALAGETGMALSFHMGRGEPGWAGPLCLTNDAPLANLWSDLYLQEFRKLTSQRGRGVWPLPDKRFPRNPYFVNKGPKNGTVLVELGNAASATDCALFDEGPGVERAAQAAADATHILEKMEVR